MNIFRRLGIALNILGATATLAGCGAAQPVAAVPNVRGVTINSIASSLRNQARGRDLLYTFQGEDVDVYTYPGGKLLGSLGAVGGWLCSDRLGNVFIGVSNSFEVLEYAHGDATPKTTLNDPTFAGPCSVDPTTGSVAVTSRINAVVVFPYKQKRGWRFAKTYTMPDIEFPAYCAYDPDGNLFVDGANSSEAFALDELPKGAQQFEPIELDQSIAKAGGVQWDGSYIAVQDAGANSKGPAVIYQFSISGGSGTEVGSTTLMGGVSYSEYWIQGSRIVGAHLKGGYSQSVGIWPYPAGGAPQKVIDTKTPTASVTVSLPNR